MSKPRQVDETESVARTPAPRKGGFAVIPDGAPARRSRISRLKR
jgi:hypothetical protein